jgi:site-specific DNA-cytosine methylase
VGIKSIAAIDIVKDPCDTYKHNYPDVNVMQLGISRCLATAKRLVALKASKKSSSSGGTIDKVIDFRISKAGAYTRPLFGST